MTLLKKMRGIVLERVKIHISPHLAIGEEQHSSTNKDPQIHTIQGTQFLKKILVVIHIGCIRQNIFLTCSFSKTRGM